MRPPTGATNPSATKADFCRYNEAFEQYVYTEAWVNYLLRKLSDQDTYDTVPRTAGMPSARARCSWVQP